MAFDWDDLRIFLATARAGSLAAAGQRLGIDTATVSRRVTRLESALKSTLLVRSRAGLQLTAVGAELLAAGVEAESAMGRAERVSHPDVVAGTVRISAAEGFGTKVLAPALPDLVRKRPGLRVELAASSGFLSPSRREVDLAITLSAPDSDRLVVEPLTTYQLALYASREYLAARGEPQNLAQLADHQVVGYVDDLIYAAELRYLEEVMPGLTPSLASSSIRAQHELIAAGGGVGILPCFLAAGLVRVLREEVLLERRFWLSTHGDVSETARMRVVRRWLKELVEEKRSALRPFSASA
jgi:DNA-binding transcriptional LysR family regulator